MFRWVNNGGMFIAHNAVRLDEYKRLFTIGRDSETLRILEDCHSIQLGIVNE